MAHVQARDLQDHPDLPSLDQSRLNIATKTRSSRLPWRGQFSPELVEYLILAVCHDAKTFFDPFAGSGTVLYEALRHGRSAYGLEINPAAWHLATLASFASSDNKSIKAASKKLLALQDHAAQAGTLFAKENEAFSFERLFSDGAAVANLPVAAAILLGMGNRSAAKADELSRAAVTVLSVLGEVSEYKRKAFCFLRDARQNDLADQTVDAVITSPPYINVFNYHQNYRPACELLGWRPLEAARSEIGSNRKNRQNRFLTVIQYCIDMQHALLETARVMRPQAPLVIVLGKTSNVLGTPFENSRLIKKLIEQSGRFGEVSQKERVFLNRFGEWIFEDILVTYRTTRDERHSLDPRNIGTAALREALRKVPKRNRPALEEAIANASSILESPLLSLTVPNFFKGE